MATWTLNSGAENLPEIGPETFEIPNAADAELDDISQPTRTETDEEIEAERGVITEEWRTRRNAGFRMYSKSLPYIYNNSIRLCFIQFGENHFVTP